MTYAECRDLSLHLVHEQEIAGEVIPGTYNNHQDYLDKIPGLINAALTDIATTVRKIPAEVLLEDLDWEDYHGSRLYILPRDLYRKRGSGVLIPTRHGFERYNQVRYVGNTKLAVMGRVPGDAIFEYFRYPKLLGAQPADTDKLDGPPEVCAIVPYYVGAHLIRNDDAFQYASLYNEYKDKKNEMVEPLYTEVDSVHDVYTVGDYCRTEYNWWG